jgi:hypothetical protein
MTESKIRSALQLVAGLMMMMMMMGVGSMGCGETKPVVVFPPTETGNAWTCTGTLVASGSGTPWKSQVCCNLETTTTSFVQSFCNTRCQDQATADGNGESCGPISASLIDPVTPCQLPGGTNGPSCVPAG